MTFTYALETNEHGPDGSWDEERHGEADRAGTAGDYALELLADYIRDVRHDADDEAAEPMSQVRVTVRIAGFIRAQVTYAAT
jgi:hypothetical protein